jgi:hypothetical protein
MSRLWESASEEAIAAIRMFCRPGYTVAYSGPLPLFDE